MNSTQRYPTTSMCASQEVSVYDTELLRAARAGSHAAFGELQKLYNRRLYRRILSITRNREDAEDALQDTFLRAYIALPSFEGRSQLSSWLTKIAINSALMVIRKRRARPEISIDQRPGSEDRGISYDVRDNAPDPEQICDQRERLNAILSEIKRLAPRLRTPLRVRLSQGRSMKEIARDLGISTAALKTRLHRARQRLGRSAILRSLSTKRTAPAQREVVVRAQN